MGLENVGLMIAEKFKGGSCVIVTDRNVAELYLSDCKQSIEKNGIDTEVFIIEAGEKSKNGKVWLELLNFMASIPLTRSDFVVALGGGVVGDLAGFAAATYLRGIEIVQVPTTLLAAVDSSVGGKTAINLDAGKNLAGAFHQPALVIQDSTFLKTLPENIYKDGMAEIIKYGIIKDRNLFTKLKNPEWTRKNIDYVISECVKIKSSFVSEDAHDQGIRQMLNFGHTIGHAIEKATDYEVSHGSAVARGMLRIAEISKAQGWCSEETVIEIENILELYGFDVKIEQGKETLYSMMLSDKKRKGSTINLVIPKEIGKCSLKEITIDKLGEIL